MNVINDSDTVYTAQDLFEIIPFDILRFILWSPSHSCFSLINCVFDKIDLSWYVQTPYAALTYYLVGKTLPNMVLILIAWLVA